MAGAHATHMTAERERTLSVFPESILVSLTQERWTLQQSTGKTCRREVKAFGWKYEPVKCLSLIVLNWLNFSAATLAWAMYYYSFVCHKIHSIKRNILLTEKWSQELPCNSELPESVVQEMTQLKSRTRVPRF